jgi:hypothetical protein
VAPIALPARSCCCCCAARCAHAASPRRRCLQHRWQAHHHVILRLGLVAARGWLRQGMATGGEILPVHDGDDEEPQDNQGGLAKDKGDAADAADDTATGTTEELPQRGAGSPLHVRYPGVSAEQFEEWRAAFEARVDQGKHANLKTQAELDIIVNK